MNLLQHAPSCSDVKKDILGGLVVFLIALPLCLGIAVASGAPIISGLIAGIVGGIIVSLFSGSEVSVSGPAAGLTIICADAILHLGSFETFLAAIIASGIIQLLFGFSRFGFIADYFPTSVIKGMLAAIGIVILLKQIPHALGRDGHFQGSLGFWGNTEKSNTFSDIVSAISLYSTGALIITVLCLTIMVLWGPCTQKISQTLANTPSFLVAIIAGTLTNEIFCVYFPSLALLSVNGHLLNVGIEKNLFSSIPRPDYFALLNIGTWSTGLLIAVVGSIESLLSIEIADKLDTNRRISNPNRELVAQGIGNTASGVLGGLPITSVVVRTSVSIFSGSRTRWASFAHGIFILASLILIPSLLNRIPLAALASVLLFVGYRLANISLFRTVWKQGPFQFIPFITTIIAIVLTDLLSGVLLGLAVGLLFVLKESHRSAFTMVCQDNIFMIKFNKDVSFLNRAELKAKLLKIPKNSMLILDGTKASQIGNDIKDLLREFIKTAEYKNISIEYRHIRGIDNE